MAIQCFEFHFIFKIKWLIGDFLKIVIFIFYCNFFSDVLFIFLCVWKNHWNEHIPTKSDLLKSKHLLKIYACEYVKCSFFCWLLVNEKCNIVEITLPPSYILKATEIQITTLQYLSVVSLYSSGLLYELSYILDY